MKHAHALIITLLALTTLLSAGTFIVSLSSSTEPVLIENPVTTSPTIVEDKTGKGCSYPGCPGDLENHYIKEHSTFPFDIVITNNDTYSYSKFDSTLSIAPINRIGDSDGPSYLIELQEITKEQAPMYIGEDAVIRTGPGGKWSTTWFTYPDLGAEGEHVVYEHPSGRFFLLTFNENDSIKSLDHYRAFKEANGF